MTPQELIRALVLLVLLLPFLALMAHADPPPPELGVTVTRATDCERGCWALATLEYRDPEVGGGLHHIFVRAIRGQDQTADQAWTVVWPSGSAVLMTKPAPDWGDYAMFGCYNPENGPGPYAAYMGLDPAQSDIVWGMGLPQCHHVSYYLTYVWRNVTLPPKLYLPIVSEP